MLVEYLLNWSRIGWMMLNVACHSYFRIILDEILLLLRASPRFVKNYNHFATSVFSIDRAFTTSSGDFDDFAHECVMLTGSPVVTSADFIRRYLILLLALILFLRQARSRVSVDDDWCSVPSYFLSTLRILTWPCSLRVFGSQLTGSVWSRFPRTAQTTRALLRVVLLWSSDYFLVILFCQGSCGLLLFLDEG